MCTGKTLPTIILAGMLVIFVAGCGGSASPTAPNTTGPELSDSRLAQSNPNEFCWGLYDIGIDPVTESIDIIPLRTAMFEANVTKFLHPPLAPINLLTMSIQPGTIFPNGYIVVNISIRHPFPGTNLPGFDVMGIFMPPDGNNVSAWDSSLTFNLPCDPGGARLLNPDGYTRWWNQVEFTSYDTIFGYTEGAMAVHGFESSSTLNPFKYFADNLDPEDPFDFPHLNMTDRGSFATVTPGINTRRYEIQFPMGPLKPDFRFKYAITSSYWGPEGDFTPPAETEDFPLSANRAEASQILVSDGGSGAFYENETTYGGDLVLNLEITDWQGMESMDGPVSEIGGIYAESPTLFDGVVDLMETGIIAYEPMNPTMSLNGCTINGVTPDGVFDQYLLIIITSANPTDYSVQLPDVGGFDYPEDAVLAAFTVWEAPISPFAPQEEDPCDEGPNLICSGDGNVFCDDWVEFDDNEQLYRNIITFDLGGPNSDNTVVKYYTGHGGNHNNSLITGNIKNYTEDEGFTLVDTNEEPIDTTDCRIIFICLPGDKSSAQPFTQAEYDDLVTFMNEGGRIVITQEYSDGSSQIQAGNNLLDGLGSSIDRLTTSTSGKLHAVPNECYAITDGVGMVYVPAYTSFSLGSGDMSFIDDSQDWHVLVGDWL